MNEKTNESIFKNENSATKCSGDISSSEEPNVESEFKFSASPSFENIFMPETETQNVKKNAEFEEPCQKKYLCDSYLRNLSVYGYCRLVMNEFVQERNWNKYHTPRNLLLAMVGEVGELSELFQWRGEVLEGLPDWTEEEKVHLGEELSDVLIYLIRLSEKCQIDLPAAVMRKISKNKEKYPASKVWGSSKKYTEYE